MRPLRIFLSLIFLSFALPWLTASAKQSAKPDQPQLDTSRGDKMLAEYFANETAKLRKSCLPEIKTLDDWDAKQIQIRKKPAKD